MEAVVFIFYGSMVFFAIAVLVRVIMFLRAPLHLRWEIYKGSSHFEQSKWYEHGDISTLEKLKSAALDILLLREFNLRNRGFWYVLIIFHTGLFLLILWHAALFITALVIDAETAATWLVVWGHIATAIILIGGLGILIKRLTDADMKVYYARTHFIKWIFILVTLVGGFYSVQFFFEGDSVQLVQYVNEQMQFDFSHKLEPEVVPSLHVLFIAAWLIYLPFSHVLQLVFRYYHEIRWDHATNVRGSRIESIINKQVGKPVSWSDWHVGAGRTWGEVVSGLPEEKTESRGE